MFTHAQCLSELLSVKSAANVHAAVNCRVGMFSVMLQQTGARI